ncbi:peptidoglycan-recognition protein 1-like isoform X2 [Hermetia illucens]|uniref:peptidoglycan-recognition protein 1-like isoform X2 n=1 Tax=Hermetia illucens TaxID=343691 RepID=UPI0018CC704A|nr:peptidoglycan-recognition protein 1-like isoform X2 [Hermetia illucens]
MVKIYLVIFFVILVAAEERSCPNFKTRNNWEAKDPTTVEYQTFPVPIVIIHHTASPNCSTFRECATRVKNIQHYHQVTKKYPDISYNFLVGGDGNVYEAVGWHKVGTHTVGYNNRSIAIAFIGNFNDELPVPEALQAAKDLIQCGVELGEIKKAYKLFGARQLVKTQSPGLTLNAEIQEWDNWNPRP